jgi:hypothetical protein
MISIPVANISFSLDISRIADNEWFILAFSFFFSFARTIRADDFLPTLKHAYTSLRSFSILNEGGFGQFNPVEGSKYVNCDC